MYQVVQALFQIQRGTMAKNNRFHPNKSYDCLAQQPHRHQFLPIIIIAMGHGTVVVAVRPAVLRQQHIRYDIGIDYAAIFCIYICVSNCTSNCFRFRFTESANETEVCPIFMSYQRERWLCPVINTMVMVLEFVSKAVKMRVSLGVSWDFIIKLAYTIQIIIILIKIIILPGFSNGFTRPNEKCSQEQISLNYKGFHKLKVFLQ